MTKPVQRRLMTGFVRRLHPRVDEQLARLIVAEAVLAAAEFAGHVEAAMLLEMVFDLFLTERQQHRAAAVARAAAGELHRLGIEPAPRIFRKPAGPKPEE